MEIVEFKERAERSISELEDLIHQMPQNGNSTKECQRVYLQQKLNEFHYAVNGTEIDDLGDNSENS